MRKGSRMAAASVIGIAMVVQSVGASAQLDVSAPSDPSDWAAVDVPGLADLAAPADVATAADGSAVLAGFSLGDSAAALAWYSPDGDTWSPVELPDSRGSFVLSVVGGPAGFVAVGRDEDAGRIWHSPTGETWTDVSDGLAPRGSVFDVDATPSGYTAVGHVGKGRGRRARSEPTAWSSADGVTWTASPIADRNATTVELAVTDDGRSVAALFEPGRERRRRGRVVETLPPSLTIATSSDGVTWQVADGKPLVPDVGALEVWSVSDAAGRFLFRADARPDAAPGTPDGFLASDDGSAWTSVPSLVGIGGSVAPLGDGVVAVGTGTVHLSDDGATWRSAHEAALEGSWLTSVAALADGRVLASGLTSFPDGGAVLYRGTPVVETAAPSSDCLDPDIHARLTGDPESLADLPGPERERAAAAIAALQPSDAAAAGTLAGVARSLRQGESLDPTSLLGIRSGEVLVPACP